jgi:hypothetical protein
MKTKAFGRVNTSEGTHHLWELLTTKIISQSLGKVIVSALTAAKIETILSNQTIPKEEKGNDDAGSTTIRARSSPDHHVQYETGNADSL